MTSGSEAYRNIVDPPRPWARRVGFGSPSATRAAPERIDAAIAKARGDK